MLAFENILSPQIYQMIRKANLSGIILICILLLKTSCSHIAFWKSDKYEEIAQAERTLIAAIDSILVIDPATDPKRYSEVRNKFENALKNYLIVTDKRDRSIVHMDYQGGTVIIPVRRIDHIGDQVEFIHTETARAFWQRVGPEFRGEIIDVAAIHIGEERTKIAALFTDSLVVLPSYLREDTVLSISIHERYKKSVRSRIPAGIMNTEETRVYFSTVQADTSFMFDVEGDNDSLVVNPFPQNIKPITGRPYFEYYGNEQPGQIATIRSMRDHERNVLIDDNGIMSVRSAVLDTLFWKSERPWGRRLFKISENSFAVTNHDDNVFIVFELRGDTVTVKGVSPEFHSTVGAVTHTELMGNNGYIVSITTGGQKTDRYSQLYFVPDTLMRWQDEMNAPLPEYPDYDANVTLIDNYGDIFDMTYLPWELHPYVRHNVYEALLTADELGTYSYNLISAIQPDENYMQWDITVQPDIKFSNGTILDANHVKAAWLRNFEECDIIECGMQWLSQVIDSIEIIDSLNMRVILTSSRPNFKKHLTGPCFHIVKISDDNEFPVGTGPFTIKDRNRDRIILKRNPYYRHGEAFLNEITILLRQTNTIEFVTGNAKSGALLRQPREIDFFEAIDALQSRKGKQKKIYFLALNPTSELLSSIDARSRIINTYDRQAVLTVVTGARSEIATSFFTETENQSYHPDGSSSRSFSNPLRIFYYARDPVAEQIAQRLAVRLQQEGIPARPPEGLERDRWRIIRNSRQYDILVDSMLPYFESPSYNLYELLHRGYIFDDELETRFQALLKANGDDEATDLEVYLHQNKYLYPLIRTPFYMVYPRELYDLDFRGNIILDFSGAWYPK